MKREAITERIETRRNEAADGDEITLGETHSVYLGEGHGLGTLTVEYKPRGHRLNRDGLKPLADSDFFVSNGDNPEQIVSELYHALVGLLYPRSSYLDEPWDTLPLIVELETGDSSNTSGWYASLGTYR